MSLQGDNTDLFVSPVPQVRFAKKDDSGWVHITEQELENTESLSQEINTKQMILLYDSQETKKRLIQALSRLGVDFQEEKGGFLSRDNVRDGWVVVETQIDEVILRCMAKIAFNYLAKTAGDEFVKKSDFDSIRSFIREGVRPKHDFVRISNYPILAYDSLTYRQTNGHLVTVNWSPDGRDIVSQVSLFNHRVYRFRLARRFSGLWRNIRSGHHFSIEHRKIEPLYTRHYID